MNMTSSNVTDTPVSLVTCSICGRYYLLGEQDCCPQCGSNDYDNEEPVWGF